MVGHAIKDAAHQHGGSGGRNMVAKHSRAVRTGENRLGHVLADLAPVDVPRRADIDIARPVSGHIPVDEADSFVCPAIGIARDALNARTGTVAHTDACHLYSPDRNSVVSGK